MSFVVIVDPISGFPVSADGICREHLHTGLLSRWIPGPLPNENKKRHMAVQPAARFPEQEMLCVSNVSLRPFLDNESNVKLYTKPVALAKGFSKLPVLFGFK